MDFGLFFLPQSDRKDNRNIFSFSERILENTFQRNSLIVQNYNLSYFDEL